MEVSSPVWLEHDEQSVGRDKVGKVSSLMSENGHFHARNFSDFLWAMVKLVIYLNFK